MLPYLLIAAVAVIAMSRKKTNGATPNGATTAGFPGTTDQQKPGATKGTRPLGTFGPTPGTDITGAGPDGSSAAAPFVPPTVTPGSVEPVTQSTGMRSPDFAGHRHTHAPCPYCGTFH
jgi:hypothetical protein